MTLGTGTLELRAPLLEVRGGCERRKREERRRDEAYSVSRVTYHLCNANVQTEPPAGTDA